MKSFTKSDKSAGLPSTTFINKSGAGFTLMELLVVIAIIAILSSIGIISLNSTRQRAKDITVLGQLSDLAPAIFLCLDDGKNLKCIDLPGVLPENEYCEYDVNKPPVLPTYPDYSIQDWYRENIDSETPTEIPICDDSQTNWPDIREQGWNYGLPEAGALEYKLDEKTWTLDVFNDGGAKQITCKETGCTTNYWD